MQNLNSIYPYIIGLPNNVETVALQEWVFHLNPKLKLPSVLCIPELKCNLISLHQLAWDSKCFVTLSDNLCVIHDRNSMRPIRVGERKNEIFFYKPL